MHKWMSTSAVVMALLAGCNGPPPEQGLRMLAEGQRLLQAGQNRQAMEQADHFLREFSHTTRADQAYYLRGEARFRERQYEIAEADFRKALDLTGDRRLRGNVNAALGELAQRQERMNSALVYYTSALANLEASEPPADAVGYRLGEVRQAMGRWEQADEAFHRVIHAFAGSDAARLAGQRVNARAWTVRAGAFDNHQAAVALARQLQQSKIQAQVQAVFTRKGPLHVVQVGRFPDRAQAQERLDQLRPLVPKAELAVTQ